MAIFATQPLKCWDHSPDSPITAMMSHFLMFSCSFCENGPGNCATLCTLRKDKVTVSHWVVIYFSIWGKISLVTQADLELRIWMPQLGLQSCATRPDLLIILGSENNPNVSWSLGKQMRAEQFDFFLFNFLKKLYVYKGFPWMCVSASHGVRIGYWIQN